MAKVTLDSFAKEVEKILDSYGDEVTRNLDEITQKVGKKGAQLLRNQSSETFPVPTSSRKSTGKYAKGWTYQVTKNRLYTTVTIYNRTPGLPHLLENGHVIRNGGRTTGQAKAHVHIEPVEREILTEYEREVVNKL